MRSVAIDRFERPASLPLLADNEVHIWRLALKGAPKPRETTAAAHSFIGGMLMHYANVGEAPAIVRSERGKPFAPSLPDIDFNLSHARDHVLIAIARGQPLGIDIEHVDRDIDIEGLARRFFAAAEADALAALPEAQRTEAFMRLWTCKEAVLKALGEGLAFGLDRVAFALDGAGVPTGLAALPTEAGHRDAWQLALLEPAPGFLGALAWRGGPRTIRAFAAADA